MRNIELTAYLWIHKHYDTALLDWNSPYTWWLGLLGVDCGYYWVHRMAHGKTTMLYVRMKQVIKKDAHLIVV